MKRFSVLHALIVVLLTLSLSACAGLPFDGGFPNQSSLNLLTNYAVDRGMSQITIVEEAEQIDEDEPDEAVSTFGPFIHEAIFVDIYDQVSPSVVNIQVKAEVDPPIQRFETVPPLPDWFQMPGFPEFSPEFRFEQNPDLQPMPRQGLGSGFVYDSAGHIVTNHHVVQDATEIVVVFADGTEADATLIGSDPDTDLAVIQVDEVPESLLVPVELAAGSELEVGEFVVAIGNPFGLSGSMTTGIISGLGRILPATGSQFSIPDVIQIDAAINPGNSGGPLLNLDGEVIGVNTAITSPYRAFSGIGYAVPVETVQSVVPMLIAQGFVEHPWLGIMGQELNRQTAVAMELPPEQKGVLVIDIADDSPAFESKLQGSTIQTTMDDVSFRVGGDIIVAIDGFEIKAFDDLLSYLGRETQVGQTVTLEILRNGERIEVELTLAARPQNES